MSQKDLARALGVSPALVSRLKKRGMPTHSAEAAKAWRSRNVGPYVKSPASAYAIPTTPTPIAAAVRASTAPPPRPADPPGDPFAATVDELEAALHGAAVMPADDAVACATALGQMAGQRLAAGEPLGELEPTLRAALRAVPLQARERVALPLRVFDALCREVIDAAEASFPSPAAREADRQAYAASSEESREAMGRFWFSVAAGEVTLPERRGHA